MVTRVFWVVSIPFPRSSKMLLVAMVILCCCYTVTWKFWMVAKMFWLIARVFWEAVMLC